MIDFVSTVIAQHGAQSQKGFAKTMQDKQPNFERLARGLGMCNCRVGFVIEPSFQVFNRRLNTLVTFFFGKHEKVAKLGKKGQYFHLRKCAKQIFHRTLPTWWKAGMFDSPSCRTRLQPTICRSLSSRN